MPLIASVFQQVPCWSVIRPASGIVAFGTWARTMSRAKSYRLADASTSHSPRVLLLTARPWMKCSIDVVVRAKSVGSTVYARPSMLTATGVGPLVTVAPAASRRNESTPRSASFCHQPSVYDARKVGVMS